MTPAGFPHSGTHGSTLLCSSPWRFAAYAPFIGLLSQGIRRMPFVAFIRMANLYSRCVVPQHYATVKEHGAVRSCNPFRLQDRDRPARGSYTRTHPVSQGVGPSSSKIRGATCLLEQQSLRRATTGCELAERLACVLDADPWRRPVHDGYEVRHRMAHVLGRRDRRRWSDLDPAVYLEHPRVAWPGGQSLPEDQALLFAV